MTSVAWNKCECCGKLSGYILESALAGNDGQAPTMCATCIRRAGLCLHNISSRAGTEQEGLFHFSCPHPYPNSFADDPENCPPCVNSRARAAWVRTLPELQREDGEGVSWLKQRATS